MQKSMGLRHLSKNFRPNMPSITSIGPRCKVANPTFKKAGRPYLLDETLLKKVKDIAIGTRAAGGVINRKQILNIAKVLLEQTIPMR